MNNSIATAPEVPSSTTTMNYYNPRNYPTTANRTPAQQQYTDMNVVMTAVAAANNSLPPLSHLLPMDNSSNKPTTTTNDNTATTTATDYFSPQQSTTIDQQERPQQRSSPTGNVAVAVPSQPQQYRKSIDYQRAMYPPPPSQLPSTDNRRYASGSNNSADFYMLSQPQPQPTSTLSHFAPPPASPNTIVPSSTDMSVYSPLPPTHPYSTTTTNRGGLHQHYHLPSPPTSVIDGVLVATSHHHYHPNNQYIINGCITNNSQKVFSFVPLPGLNQKKRPRRKFNEVERLYQCNHQNCKKSYGTLNHLNAHVSMQRHGAKRQPTEFKELRKMWRKQKRDNKQRSGSKSTTNSLEDSQQDMLHSTSESNILSHSTTSDGPILSHHHDYMPPYMHHTHPSLMSPAPPPPPPPPTTLWRPHHHHYQQATEFMPPTEY